MHIPSINRNNYQEDCLFDYLLAKAHFPGQYQLYKQLGWKEEHFHKQYMGVVMQSNWGAPLKY